MAAVLAVIVVIAIVVLIKYKTPPSSHSSSSPSFRLPDFKFETEERRVGRRREKAATGYFSRVLHADDVLLTNVEITYDDKPAEMDNVIVNSYGVFIIEMKNYKGVMVGEEDDYKWKKYKATGAGNIYEKDVKNPIKQVKRQVYVLAKYLEYYGAKVWVEGYAFFVENNSPVQSKYVLKNLSDIDKAIHTPGRRRLSKREVEKIVGLLR